MTTELVSAVTKASTFAAPAFMASRQAGLQRKCSCGQHTGGGPCGACKKHDPGTRPSPSGTGARGPTDAARELRALSKGGGQRGFAEMRVSAEAPEPAIARTREPGGADQTPDDGAQSKYSDKGVLMTLAGSGTCLNGGAESACDPEIGAYRIYRNNNTCCTKDCSWLHEQTHVSDITGWGCCKALSVAYNKPGADKAAAVQKYNDWLTSALSLTECHAYTNGVECAKQLARQKDCAGAGRNTDCCKDIQEYQTKYSARAATECAAAPRQPPACPAF